MESFDRSSGLASPLPERVWTFALTVAALLFSLGYVAIAVAGWGWRDWRGFFDNPCRMGVCIGMVILFTGTFLFGCNITHRRRDHSGNNWIFLPMFGVGLAMGWLPAYQDRRNICTIGGGSIAYLGLTLFIIGTIFRLAAVQVLGPRHSVWVAVQHSHRLVTTGLYRFIRHPSYVGALLAVFGWALAFRGGIAILLGLLMVPPILSRIEAEETLLAVEFGDEYRDYQRRTWRLMPFVY